MDEFGEGNDNIIFVGTKPLMAYVNGVVTQFASLNASEVIVRARGKFIAKAVDVAEVAVRRFLIGEIENSSVVINSEEFENKEGKQVLVSTIEISLKKIM